MSSDTAIDSTQTYGSQETISKEKAGTDFFENMENAVTLQHSSVLQQQKTKSAMPVFFIKEKEKVKQSKHHLI